jgi:sortase A
VAGLFLALGLALLGQGMWIPIKAQLAQVLLARAWAQTLQGNAAPPWPGADTTAVAELSFAGKSFVVLSGGSGQALAFAPSHLPGTPLPGETGLSVIAAHRDTHFAGLAELAPGQIITARRADGSLRRFRVSGGRIMDARTARLNTQDGPPRLALTTCWPLDSPVPGGPLRLVLFTNLIPTPYQHDTNIKPADPYQH